MVDRNAPPPAPKTFGVEKNNIGLPVIGVLSAIWALGALGLGLMLVINAEAIADLALESYGQEFFDEYGITYEFFMQFVALLGAVLTASGALAAVTAVTAFMKKFYTVALVTCIISSILGMVILLGIIGLFVANLIRHAKDEFDPSGIKM